MNAKRRELSTITILGDYPFKSPPELLSAGELSVPGGEAVALGQHHPGRPHLAAHKYSHFRLFGRSQMSSLQSLSCSKINNKQDL
jgi:hypothetical protein